TGPARPRARARSLHDALPVFNEEYTTLARQDNGRITDVDRDGTEGEWQPRSDERVAPAQLVAHHWLRGRKKGMLSSFVTGTIDQDRKSTRLNSSHVKISYAVF